MARFDVHRDRQRPDLLLLAVQSDLLEGLRTRLVVPMFREAEFEGFLRNLHLRAVLTGESYVVATHLMAAIDRRQLGDRVGSLADRRFEIVAAIDFLLQGF